MGKIFRISRPDVGNAETGDIQKIIDLSRVACLK